MADHALAGRHPQFELVLDRMSRLLLGNHRVNKLHPVIFFSGRQASVTILGEKIARDRISIVGIQHMTGGATAAAIVTGVIVGTQEVEGRIEKPSFL